MVFFIESKESVIAFLLNNPWIKLCLYYKPVFSWDSKLQQGKLFSIKSHGKTFTCTRFEMPVVFMGSIFSRTPSFLSKFSTKECLLKYTFSPGFAEEDHDKWLWNLWIEFLNSVKSDQTENAYAKPISFITLVALRLLNKSSRHVSFLANIKYVGYFAQYHPINVPIMEAISFLYFF